jgi:hypothetical protein
MRALVKAMLPVGTGRGTLERIATVSVRFSATR